MVPKCLGSEVSWVRSVLTPVVIVDETLECEYVTEFYVAPPGVRKLNKQAVEFGYVIVKVISGVQMEAPPSELCGNALV